MMRDLATVERYCAAGDAERRLLSQSAAPVALLAMQDAAAFPSRNRAWPAPDRRSCCLTRLCTTFCSGGGSVHGDD